MCAFTNEHRAALVTFEKAVLRSLAEKTADISGALKHGTIEEGFSVVVVGSSETASNMIATVTSRTDRNARLRTIRRGYIQRTKVISFCAGLRTCHRTECQSQRDAIHLPVEEDDGSVEVIVVRDWNETNSNIALTMMTYAYASQAWSNGLHFSS